MDGWKDSVWMDGRIVYGWMEGQYMDGWKDSIWMEGRIVYGWSEGKCMNVSSIQKD